MNTSLLAGIGAGTGLVVAGLIGASVLFPPAQRPADPLVSEVVAQPQPAAEAQDDIAQDDPPPLDEPASDAALDVTPRADDPVQDADMQDAAPPDDLALADPLPEAVNPDEPTLAPVVVTDGPADSPILAEDVSPASPAQETQSSLARLPFGQLPAPRTDGALALPQVLAPPPEAPQSPAPDTSDAPEADGPDPVAAGPQERAALPGMRSSSLPQIGAGDQPPARASDVPMPGDAMISALERNSLYQGVGDGSRMALVLNDPGLPMAMRRSLAALDFPFTVALNPLDTTAPDAAALYNEAGKEVLILATSIPEGATASDLDVNFNAFFAALPTAVGVIDLPGTGFARNARLLGEVLPLLRQDGHGLVTFSGGLAQSERAAATAGVPHAEVFRVLDSGNDSAFTIRRYLDRAVFQASQIGQVIVFGDAANDVTMEAIEMWRAGSRLDQVALVPVSGILLDRR